jgi:hypothetical protein
MHFDTFPSYARLLELLERMVSENPKILKFETIGTSPEGRDIKAIHAATDAAPLQAKEVVLIICGRHGDELGTRVAGPAVIDWLLSAEAVPILENQHIMIVPVANPDGCAKEKFGLPPDRLSHMEKECLVRLADRYIADLVIDVHSVGKQKLDFNWAGLQAVVIDREADAGEDQHINFKMADSIIEAARAENQLFLLHGIEFYRKLRERLSAPTPGAFNNYFNRACYDALHCLNFGIELNHFVLAPDEVGQSAATIIKALLLLGNRSFPWEFAPGYPNRLLKGDFLASIRACGQTPGERRTSRKKLWPTIASWNISRAMPAPVTIQVKVGYSGTKKNSPPAGICFFAAGRRPIKTVLLDGSPVPALSVEEKAGAHVWVQVPAGIGEKQVEIVATC